MRFVNVLAASLLVASASPMARAADPQYASPPLGHIMLHDPNSTGEIGGMTVAGRSLLARAADTVNPRDFGAIGDGSSHHAGATLGISTLAGLAAYRLNGATPYSFIASAPFGPRFNLSLGADASNGAITLNFNGTATVGSQIGLAAAAMSGASSVFVADLFVTADATPIASGTPVSGSCVQSGTTVSGAPTGYAGNWTIPLSKNLSSNCASGTLLTFSISPPSGSYVLPLVWTKGVRQGDVISGSTCIQAGTQVDQANIGKMEVRLSKETVGPCSGALTFQPSWLANVTAGMTVEGLSTAVQSGTAVNSVNLSTGAVGISKPTTSAIRAGTALVGVTSPVVETTPITFSRRYTDAEAVNLQMDRLGLQATVNAVATGGHVQLPQGKYLLDGPLILPISPYSTSIPEVSLGAIFGSGATTAYLQPIADFGPASALVSCGDPAATSTNKLGLYQDSGWFCAGHLHDIGFLPAMITTNAYGMRPKWGTAPVAMDGLKQGPRLALDHVVGSGFNSGIRAAVDHTEYHSVSFGANWIGYNLDDAQAGLYGDNKMDHVFFAGNALAGINVSPRNFFQADMVNPYLGYNTFGIYCEPGVGDQSCIYSSHFTNTNAESNGCGFIMDGAIAEGFAAAGAHTTINRVSFDEFFGGTHPASDGTLPVGGCTWRAYVDVGGVYGLAFHNPVGGAFTAVPGAKALIRTFLTDPQFGAGQGGIELDGPEIWGMVQLFGAANQNIVAPPGGYDRSSYYYSAQWRNVTLRGPGWEGRPLPVAYNSNASYSLGQVVEWNLGQFQNAAAVQLAGQTPGAPVAGVICQPFSGTPWNYALTPVVCDRGTSIPVLTTDDQSPGSMVKVGTATPGTAVAASGLGDGVPLGVLMVGTSNKLGQMAALFGSATNSLFNPTMSGTSSFLGTAGTSLTVAGPRSSDGSPVINTPGTAPLLFTGAGGIQSYGGSVGVASASGYGSAFLLPPASANAPARFVTFGTTGGVTVNDAQTGRFVSAPGSATAPCTPGDFSADASYHYECRATNTWVRTAAATW